MPVFAGLEGVAGKELAVEDQSAAQPGAHEKADDVFVSLDGAVFVFAQHADVNVVPDIKGDAEAALHGGPDVVVPPGQVGGEEHDALLLVDDARGPGRDGADAFWVDAGIPDHLPDDADDDLLDVLGRISAGSGLFLETVDDLSLTVEYGAQHLCAADVKTDAIFFRHPYPSLPPLYPGPLTVFAAVDAFRPMIPDGSADVKSGIDIDRIQKRGAEVYNGKKYIFCIES